MNLFIMIFITLFSIFSGKPAVDTEIFLEKGAQNELVGYQKAGFKGEVSFKHLDAGSYSLYIIFPQQEGKYLKEKPKHQSLTKATYNPKNKSYYYQGVEGYFTIKFSGVSKIDRENFRGVFREERGIEQPRIMIAQFGAKKDGASISLKVKAITASQFKKATEKAGQDISTLSIPGIK